MVKCPFCSFANEDGALFCEQCKSDISNVAPAPASPSPAPTPMPDSFPSAVMEEDAPVMAAILEDEPVVAEVAPVVEVTPVEVVAVEAIAVEAVEPSAEKSAAVVEEAAHVAEAPPPEPPPAAPVPLTPAVAAVAADAVNTPELAPAAGKPAAAGAPIPPGSTPKLVVQRGLKIGDEYPVFAGENYIGRADEKPVDVDLTFQDPEDRVWCSRQHALLVFDEDTGALTIEDLNSSNGTFVNRERVYPGQPRQLFVGNTIQIGTVHMKIKV